MNHYLKLVHMEVHRFRLILLGLTALTAIVQFCALIISTTSQIAQRRSPEWLASDQNFSSYYMNADRISLAAIVNNNAVWYSLPIAICIAVLLIYVLFIWYRDWFGQRTFIYRLLMLPFTRKHLYWAKLTAILLFVFGLVSIQWILLVIQNALFKIIVPSDLYVSSHYSDIIGAADILKILMPGSIDEFIYSYGLGVIGVIIVFTAILIERSYRLIGILLGIGYSAVCSILLIAAALMYIDHSIPFLYPSEMLAIVATLFVLVTGLSIWLSLRLLSKKVSV
jgi:hypothetical protein